MTVQFTIRIDMTDGEHVLSAPYWYDQPGAAIKEWTDLLVTKRVVPLRLPGSGAQSWALIPRERIVILRLMFDKAVHDD